MKKSKLGCILAYSAIFCAVTIVAGNLVVNLAKADGEAEVWSHYPRVEPKLDQAGCNEYWISCSTGAISYTQPTGNVEIQNKTALSESAINDLATFDDNRYIPNMRYSTNVFCYGEYPQSEEQTLKSTLTLQPLDSNDNVVYQGKKYHKYGSSFFRYEPILWKIISTDGTKNMLVSKNVLYCTKYKDCDPEDTAIHHAVDYHSYEGNVYNSNYQFSDIRTWLNVTFKADAFKSFDRLTTVLINNSASTTCNPSNNPYASDTMISDDVFLLSYLDYSSSSYGFTSNNSRISVATDCALANGAYVNSEAGTGAYYFTRSPSDRFAYGVQTIVSNGIFNTHSAGFKHGVRPAIYLDVA